MTYRPVVTPVLWEYTGSACPGFGFLYQGSRQAPTTGGEQSVNRHRVYSFRVYYYGRTGGGDNPLSVIFVAGPSGGIAGTIDVFIIAETGASDGRSKPV